VLTQVARSTRCTVDTFQSERPAVTPVIDPDASGGGATLDVADPSGDADEGRGRTGGGVGGG
jgi:hypothetical protein